MITKVSPEKLAILEKVGSQDIQDLCADIRAMQQESSVSDQHVSTDSPPVAQLGEKLVNEIAHVLNYEYRYIKNDRDEYRAGIRGSILEDIKRNLARLFRQYDQHFDPYQFAAQVTDLESEEENTHSRLVHDISQHEITHIEVEYREGRAVNCLFQFEDSEETFSVDEFTVGSPTHAHLSLIESLLFVGLDHRKMGNKLA